MSLMSMLGIGAGGEEGGAWGANTVGAGAGKAGLE